MSEDENIIISCTVCGATADYDTPCPNGCDPLGHYLDEEIKINMEDKDFDVLTSISLKEAVELVSKWLEEDNSWIATIKRGPDLTWPRTSQR